jgi:hypothetical protein
MRLARSVGLLPLPDGQHYGPQVTGTSIWDALGQQPVGAVQDECGCCWDLLGGQMWKPCRAHESEGHLAVLSSPGDGLVTARCRVRTCAWARTEATLLWAAQEGQQHWIETRA